MRTEYPMTPETSAKINNWTSRHSGSVLLHLFDILLGKRQSVYDENVHKVIADTVLGLLALGHLCVYEMLEIIDWLPAAATWRFEYVSYSYDYDDDPYRHKKVALIEGVVRSHRRVLESRR
jgi:hypothetical protein